MAAIKTTSYFLPIGQPGFSTKKALNLFKDQGLFKPS